MATGDTSDIVQRLKSVLPASWFASDETPVLSALLSAFAAPLSWIYQLYLYTLLQMRIATATGVWIDRISYDYLGNRLPRRTVLDSTTQTLVSAELDEEYRTRVKQEIMRPRQTRAGISQALLDLTGNEPIIIELWNPYDCGGYDQGNIAFDHAGCWGSTSDNNQILVTAFKPPGGGLANVNGFDGGFGGYDVGGGEFIDLDWIFSPVSDTDIYNTVAHTIAAGMTAWTAIEPAPVVLTDIDGMILTDIGNNELLSTD